MLPGFNLLDHIAAIPEEKSRDGCCLVSVDLRFEYCRCGSHRWDSPKRPTQCFLAIEGKRAVGSDLRTSDVQM